MSVEIQNYPSVHEIALKLGVNPPAGLAFLPRNYELAGDAEELLHDGAVSTIRKLFRLREIPEDRLEGEGQKLLQVEEKNSTLVLPTLFVGAMIISQDPNLLTIALSVIANYATDFFKTEDNGIVRFNLVQEKRPGGECIRIKYEGSSTGLSKVEAIVREVLNRETGD